MKSSITIKIAMAAIALTLGASAFAQASAPLHTRYAEGYNGLLNEVNIEQPTSYVPGARVFFSMRGASGGRASVAMETSTGIKTINLTETEPGYYEGFYTVKPSDRINTDPRSRVSFSSRLEQRGRVAEAWSRSGGEHHGYGDNRYQESNRYQEPNRYGQACLNCGVITSIQRVEEGSNEANAPGIIIGGLLGGAIGNQVGQGSGRDAATALGILGGALAGNELAKNQNHHYVWVINVQLDNGTTQTFKNNEQPAVAQGQRVRVENNQLVIDRR